MTDKEFLSYFNSVNKKHTDKVLKENKIVYEYYLNRYKEKDNIKEVVYRIKNNLEEKPKCPICGNNAKFDYLKNHYTLILFPLQAPSCTSIPTLLLC